MGTTGKRLFKSDRKMEKMVLASDVTPNGIIAAGCPYGQISTHEKRDENCVTS